MVTERTAEEERARFLAAYEPEARALLAWCLLRCRGPLGRGLTAEDLSQEVVLQAWGGWTGFDPARGAFAPWLFGVAHRVAANALRRAARRDAHGAVVELGEGAQGVAAAATTITRAVRRAELIQEFERRLATWGEEDRELFGLRGLEGLGHGEVAGLLGLSEAVVQKRWQRLRDRLRDEGRLLELVRAE